MPRIHYVSWNPHPESVRLIAEARRIIAEYEQQGFTLTLRQLYYQLVARDLVPNTQKSYDRIGMLVTKGRRAGMIDWNAIEDRTRFVRKNQHFDGPAHIMEIAAKSYRRNLWENQPIVVEVWIEKDALIGVIEQSCRKLDVPFFSCRGYVSDTEMWNAAQRVIEREQYGQKTRILHLSDHDPSGLDMTRDIDDRLQLFVGDEGKYRVDRVALTKEQIDRYKPPPNPAKLTDSRITLYKQLHGRSSWELDALSPTVLNDLIQTEVEMSRDPDRFDIAFAQQETDRAKLRKARDLVF